jgi:hypothetical protein
MYYFFVLLFCIIFYSLKLKIQKFYLVFLITFFSRNAYDDWRPVLFILQSARPVAWRSSNHQIICRNSKRSTGFK